MSPINFSQLGQRADFSNKFKEIERKAAESDRQEQARIEAFNAKPLLERNGIKLSELEPEWSSLGPLRPITFSVCSYNEDEAASFAAELPDRGFEVSIQIREDKIWSVLATQTMEPTAANVTHWESWFEDRMSESSTFEGWSYPRRGAPAFGRDCSWDNTSAAERTEILFGATLCFDGIADGKFKWARGERASGPPFRLEPSKFLRDARNQRPACPEPTASGFANWIYSLYSDAFGSSRDQEKGKAAEEYIFAARRRAYASTDKELMRTRFRDWRLIHNGLHTTQQNNPTFFAIGDLRIGKEPLRSLPDLIYKNQRTGEVLIVEIKHSRMAIPSNLWPNIWGQLWCYSQLEDVRKAPRVTVVGEVWGDAWTGGRDGVCLVCLRASVRRDPRAPAYERFFRALFDIYRGAN